MNSLVPKAESPVRRFAGSELIAGRTYRVTTAFDDFDGVTHPVGETWRFVSHDFLPYEDGLTLYIEREGRPGAIRLQWRAEAQGHIASVFSDFVEETAETAATEESGATPAAVAIDQPLADPIRIYSPTQVACGTLGGPVGLVYFLWANFRALGDAANAGKTLAFGGLSIVALVAGLPFLPEEFPSSPFTIAYIVIARGVAQHLQMTKQAIADSPRHDFQSNWRVFGLGLLCLLGSVVVIMGPLFLLLVLGIWNP